MTDQSHLLTLRKELCDRGYEPVEEVQIGERTITVGDRVRHRGELYPEAIARGTAVVLEILHKPESHFAKTYGRDVEIIVLRDKPLLADLPRESTWSDYHTAPALEGSHDR